MNPYEDPPVVKLAKRHLNWTWCIAISLRFIARAAAIAFSTPDTITLFLVLDGVGWVIAIAGTLWVLHQKGRSPWWVLLAIVTPFLKNKREITQKA